MRRSIASIFFALGLSAASATANAQQPADGSAGWRLAFDLPDEVSEFARRDAFTLRGENGPISLWATLQSDEIRDDRSAALSPVDIRPATMRIGEVEEVGSAVITPHIDTNEVILEGRIGALYRFGEGLSRPWEDDSSGNLYMFAGADAQALTWRFGEEPSAREAMRLEDLPMVGDAQAGLGWRLPAGDLSLGFIHREIRHASASSEEQFGGISFVIQR